MIITMSSRELNSAVSYKSPVQQFNLKEKVEDDVLFIANTLQKEVIEGTTGQQRKKIKKLKKLLKGFVVVMGAGIQATPKAFAAAPLTGATTTVAANQITPALVMKWGLNLALISVSVGVALSMTLLTLAGIYRMMRKRKEAEEWSVDVIKGLVQVLVAVPVVYLLFYLAQTVFKSLPILSGLF
ncbi:hypothetical protein Grass_185 [Bacillus phage Grass]|uniref:Uncharacterized protein n=1 Tax=Bacillus phage Grass TaxID=1406785 RepID=U5PTZ9_BPGRA|nr:hypothetical protein Grass_185 [Bacillus phage Grass]AGY47450.1 hypothetical protein Grass_185 [Bacillus phage Grass]